eukprot:GHVH01000362.1.p1 GENE.GHVH01000362.1~~GHVH01000362.1.p1  ORF type:complete len:1425 (-),score=232.02 GHVH01000362.1:97-4200(-)
MEASPERQIDQQLYDGFSDRSLPALEPSVTSGHVATTYPNSIVFSKHSVNHCLPRGLQGTTNDSVTVWPLSNVSDAPVFPNEGEYNVDRAPKPLEIAREGPVGNITISATSSQSIIQSGDHSSLDGVLLNPIYLNEGGLESQPGSRVQFELPAHVFTSVESLGSYISPMPSVEYSIRREDSMWSNTSGYPLPGPPSQGSLCSSVPPELSKGYDQPAKESKRTASDMSRSSIALSKLGLGKQKSSLVYLGTSLATKKDGCDEEPEVCPSIEDGDLTDGSHLTSLHLRESVGRPHVSFSSSSEDVPAIESDVESNGGLSKLSESTLDQRGRVVLTVSEALSSTSTSSDIRLQTTSPCSKSDYLRPLLNASSTGWLDSQHSDESRASREGERSKHRLSVASGVNTARNTDQSDIEEYCPNEADFGRMGIATIQQSISMQVNEFDDASGSCLEGNILTTRGEYRQRRESVEKHEAISQHSARSVLDCEPISDNSDVLSSSALHWDELDQSVESIRLQKVTVARVLDSKSDDNGSDFTSDSSTGIRLMKPVDQSKSNIEIDMMKSDDDFFDSDLSVGEPVESSDELMLPSPKRGGVSMTRTPNKALLLPKLTLTKTWIKERINSSGDCDFRVLEPRCPAAHVAFIDVDDTLIPTSELVETDNLDTFVENLPPKYRERMEQLDAVLSELLSLLFCLVREDEKDTLECFIFSVVVVTNATIIHIKLVFPRLLPRSTVILKKHNVTIDELVCSSRDMWQTEYPLENFYDYWKAWTFETIIADLVPSVTVVSIGDDEPERRALGYLRKEFNHIVSSHKALKFTLPTCVRRVTAQLMWLMANLRTIIDRSRSSDTFLTVVPVSSETILELMPELIPVNSQVDSADLSLLTIASQSIGSITVIPEPLPCRVDHADVLDLTPMITAAVRTNILPPSMLTSTKPTPPGCDMPSRLSPVTLVPIKWSEMECMIADEEDPNFTLREVDSLDELILATCPKILKVSGPSNYQGGSLIISSTEEDTKMENEEIVKPVRMTNSSAAILDPKYLDSLERSGTVEAVAESLSSMEEGVDDWRPPPSVAPGTPVSGCLVILGEGDHWLVREYVNPNPPTLPSMFEALLMQFEFKYLLLLQIILPFEPLFVDRVPKNRCGIPPGSSLEFENTNQDSETVGHDYEPKETLKENFVSFAKYVCRTYFSMSMEPKLFQKVFDELVGQADGWIVAVPEVKPPGSKYVDYLLQPETIDANYLPEEGSQAYMRLRSLILLADDEEKQKIYEAKRRDQPDQIFTLNSKQDHSLAKLSTATAHADEVMTMIVFICNLYSEIPDLWWCHTMERHRRIHIGLVCSLLNMIDSFYDILVTSKYQQSQDSACSMFDEEETI